MEARARLAELLQYEASLEFDRMMWPSDILVLRKNAKISWSEFLRFLRREREFVPTSEVVANIKKVLNGRK